MRQILVNEKGYPDPADCSNYDENGIIMYSQDDYKNSKELKKLFEHASKCSSKESSEKLWSDIADYGKPEFVIINNKTNLAIVIECKKAQKTNNHISNILRDNKVLPKKSDVISKYAVDGALHYVKFLSMDYDVIAIGVSGILNSEELNVSTYYWKQNSELQHGKNDKYEYCFGAFYDLCISSLASYQYYKKFIDNESMNIIKEFSEEKAFISANELNVMLDSAGVNTTERAILVSGLLLALRDRTFQSTYNDKEIPSNQLQNNLHNAIQNFIDSGDIEDDYKKKVLKDKFSATFKHR